MPNARTNRTEKQQTASEGLPAAALEAAGALVAHADRALAALDAAGDVGKRLREQTRALIQLTNAASAAGFLAAVAVQREHVARTGVARGDVVASAEAAARALLEAAGYVADSSPKQGEAALAREAIADAAPAGTVLAVLAPAWRSASGELVAAGVALVSSGPPHALEVPLERAARAARRLARRAEDVKGKTAELGAGLGTGLGLLDKDGVIERALEAIRLVEALAASHTNQGQDVAEAGIADLVLLLETLGVRRVPPLGGRVERAGTETDDADAFETEHLRVRLVADASPAGAVVKRVRSAFVRDGRLVGERGEVVVSQGQGSEDERRLETLARAEAPGSALPRAVAKWRKLGDARHGEAGARVLLELVRELGREPAAPKLTRTLKKADSSRADSPRADAARSEALALAERMLAALGVVRLEPRGDAAPGETVVVERVPDSRPEGQVVRVLEAGYSLGSRVLEPARVVVSLGPRAALAALLDGALERLKATPEVRDLQSTPRVSDHKNSPGVPELIAATRARVGGLTTSELEGSGGLEAALDLAAQLDARSLETRGLETRESASDDRLARELAAFLAARGVSRFPEDERAARADLARAPGDFDVVSEPSETPRGEVIAVVARGFRNASALLRRARVRVSLGPEDPLARALGALAAAVEGAPVPGASPLARINSLRTALSQSSRELSATATAPTTEPKTTTARTTTAGTAPAPDELLGRTVETVRAAQLLLETGRPEWSRAIQKALDEAVFPTLAACGVEVFPAFGANALTPSQATRVEAELRDAPEAPGALLEVKRRGLVLGETVYPAVVVLSRGPRPRLLDCAGIAAQGGGVLEPLAALAADLDKRLGDARRAVALGTEGEAKLRDQAFESGLAFLRAGERLRAALTDPTQRASLDSFLEGQVRPALALTHTDVEVFPLSREGLDARDLERDPSYEIEHVHDAKAPLGAVVAVVRAGVRDRRAKTPLVERARIVASLGPRPAVELALEELLLAASHDPLAPPGLEERARAVREAARALVHAPLPKHREALGHATATLLDAVEPRAQETSARADSPARALARVLDEALLPALRSLGVRPFPEEGDAVSERPSGRIEVAREHSDSTPRGALIRRVHRGLEVEGRPLRTARIVISLGPKDEVATLVDELESALRDLTPATRAPLDQALARERAALLEGRTGGAPVERALALVDALDQVLASSSDADRAHTLEHLSGVTSILARMGLELFPKAGEPLPDWARSDPRALELDGVPDFSGGARGSVVLVASLGVRQGTRVVRSGKARLDLGPRPAWLDAVLEAERAGATLAPLLERVRDPRQTLAPDALVLELHDAHRVSPRAQAPLERALAALGADVFPRAGEPLPTTLAADALETQLVYSDEVAPGSVVRTGASGLRRAGVVLRPARVEISRGPMSPSLKAVGELARAADLPEPVRAALSPIAARLEALPPEKHATEEADRAVVEALAVLEAAGEPGASGVARLVSVLRERGFVVAPDGASGSIDSLKATLGGDAALEPARRRFGSAQVGEILAVERRAVAKGDLVLAKARVVVSAGAPSELHGIVSDVRDKLSLESGDVVSLKEIDDVLERLADAKPDRLHLLAFPVMNVLHRRNLKDKLGTELKAFLRSKHVKEIVAYSGFPAAELGPKQLEEVRVNSDREKGKIVRVLRPGFVEEKTGSILQKVQAEVSR